MNYSDVKSVLEKANASCHQSFRGAATAATKAYCEFMFDGIMCWPPTPAGLLAVQPCSSEFVKSKEKGFATKQCNSDGEWLTRENETQSWTNYSQCGFMFVQRQISNETLNNNTLYDKWLPIIRNVTQTGYILSTISLIISLFIFLHIKRLHCARNKLHTHLFVSFVLRALMFLIKEFVFVRGTALPHEVDYDIYGEPIFDKRNYSWICKAIISVWNYFIISNYTFLLMEGTYLHNLLFLRLFSENGVAIYYYTGWGFPALFVVPWIILKVKKENVYCWTTKASKCISLLIDFPIGLTVIINFVLFTAIMRILFVKLTSMYVQQRWTKYQKLVRAILILVPLFGIPYAVSFVLSFYVTRNQTFEILWLFSDQTFTAFQGLFASMVYCFMNNDVQVELARNYHSFRNNKEFKRRSRTISHTTQIPLTDELPEMPQNSIKEDLFADKKTSDYF